MSTEAHRDDQGSLPLLVDHVLPLLPPYDFNVYLLLLRLTHAEGASEVRIGNRSISARLGKATRSSGGNYKQITNKLKALEALGFIRIGDATTQGTLYRVHSPDEIPIVLERLAADKHPTEDAPDYFRDPDHRRELFERDNWRCHYCGDEVTQANATLDHIVPQRLGGPDDRANLTTACLTCNSIKSGHTYEEAAPSLLRRVAERNRS